MLPGPPASSVTVTLIDEPLDVRWLMSGSWSMWDDLLCAGHAHMADESVYIAGGTRSFFNSATGEYIAEGLAHGTRATPSWLRLAGDMRGAPPGQPAARWYPTVTRLKDGRMLVSAGGELCPRHARSCVDRAYTGGDVRLADAQTRIQLSGTQAS
jgi:hypothetical protein